jgi:hypothetical protein
MIRSFLIISCVFFGLSASFGQSNFFKFSNDLVGGINTAVFKGNNGLIWYSFSQNSSTLESKNQLIFTDYDGNVQKVIQADSSNRSYRYAAVTPTGETILAGNLGIAGQFGNVGWGLITMLDQNGELLWSKRATANESGYFTGVFTDGEIIYATFTSYNFFSSTQFWNASVIAYDMSGNVLWNKPVGYPGFVSNFYFRASTIAENGDFIGVVDVGGSQNVQATGVVVVRVTPSGEISWKKFINWNSDFSHSSVNGLVEGPDGSIYVGCRLMTDQSSTFTNDLWIGKFDSSGILVDQRIYKSGGSVGENISGMSKSENELLVYVRRYSPFETIRNQVSVLGIDFQSLEIGTASSSPANISREDVYGDDGPGLVVGPDGSMFTSGVVFCEQNLTRYSTMMKWTVDANTACSTEDVSEIYYDSLSTFEAIEFNLSGGSQPQHANETAGVVALTDISFLDFCAGCDVSIGLQSPIQEETSDFYPNPSSGFIHFEKLVDSFEITDLQGRLVFKHSKGLVSSFDLTHLKPGMYFVHLKSKTSKLILKR